MNYFAHGYAFLDDPYFLAGTAVPDWLSVIDRRMRARSKLAYSSGAAANVSEEKRSLSIILPVEADRH